MVKNLRDHITFMGEFIDDTNQLVTRLLKDLRASYNISKEQANVVMMVRNEGVMTLTEITERQGVNKAAVSRRVKKLLSAGLVEWHCADDHSDQRLKYIKLTEKGREFDEACKTTISDIVNDMVSDLSQEEIEQARGVLEIIDQRLKRYNVEQQ